MSKTKDSNEFFKGNVDSAGTYTKIKDILNNKYYNIFRSNFKIEGLNYREANYIFKELWAKGTIAAFKLKHLDSLGYAPWARQTWDMYGEPETVNLINHHGSPLIPNTVQTVDRDVVIGYIQTNRKPIKFIVDWYVERIAQVDLILNTNLQLQKMPFLIPVEDKNEKEKVDDVVNKILNNQVVITIKGIDPNIFKAVATNVPYIVDKLNLYKKDLENELLTFLGVNNCGVNKTEQLQLAEVNSGNEEINLSDDDFNNNLTDFCKRVKEVLGVSISISVCGPDAQQDGQVHNNEEKPGPDTEEEGE